MNHLSEKYKLCVSLMLTTKQKPIVHTQKIMRKESKHTAKESHQTTKEESKEIRKGQKNYQTDRK